MESRVPVIDDSKREGGGGSCNLWGELRLFGDGTFSAEGVLIEVRHVEWG